jgi:hypothetical protein
MNVLSEVVCQVVPEIVIVDNKPLSVPCSKHNKKCSLCKKTDHIISQCSNEEYDHFMKQDELIFERVMFERLRTEQMEHENYYKFVTEVQKTNKNVLKYFVSKNGGLISRRNKKRLAGMYLYQLTENFISRNEERFQEFDFVFLKHLMVIIAERSFWLYIGAGHTDEEAKQIYEQRMAELNDDTCENQMTTYPIEVYTDPYTIRDGTSEREFECNICYENCCENSKVSLICNHEFCVTCVESTIKMCNETKQYPTCAMCRTDYISLIAKTDEVVEQLKPYCEY